MHVAQWRIQNFQLWEESLMPISLVYCPRYKLFLYRINITASKTCSIDLNVWILALFAASHLSANLLVGDRLVDPVVQSSERVPRAAGSISSHAHPHLNQHYIRLCFCTLIVHNFQDSFLNDCRLQLLMVIS